MNLELTGNWFYKFRTLSFYLFLLLYFSSSLYSQIDVDLKWTAIQSESGGFGNNAPKVITDIFGNIYVGSTESIFNGVDNGIMISKYDSLGVSAGQYSNNTFSKDFFVDFVVDNEGDITLAGMVLNGFQTTWKIIRYSANGEEQWIYEYPIDRNSITQLLLDEEQNIYAVNRTGNIETVGHLSLTKFDTEGNIVWDYNYTEGPGNMYFGVRARILEDKIILLGGTVYLVLIPSNKLILKEI